MSYFGNTEWEAKVALGLIPGWATVNKFGKTDNADSGTPTDIWRGADGGQPIWVQPQLTAQNFNIVSDDVNDDGSPASTGLRTLRIYGLTSWSTAEVSEDITMNGITNVATANQYVHINRMQGLTFGATGSNEGTITCIGATDAVQVAGFIAGDGQTQLAVYGWPSGKTLLLNNVTLSLLRSNTARGDGLVLVKENADQSDAGFIAKVNLAVNGGSGTAPSFQPKPPIPYAGPAIIKVQIETNTNNSTVAVNFGAYLVDD